jgi:hypothetical protein
MHSFSMTSSICAVMLATVVISTAIGALMLLVALGPTTRAMATATAAPTDPEIQIEDA